MLQAIYMYKMRFLFTTLCFLYGSLWCGAFSKIDSLKRVAETMPEDSLKCDVFLSITAELYNGPEAIEYGQRSLALGKKLGNKTLIGRSYNLLGWVYELDRMDLMASYLDSAVQVFMEIDDINGLAFVYNSKGSILLEYGDLEQAKQAFKKSHEYFSQTHNELRKYTALNNIAVVLIDQKKPEEALPLLYEALDFRLTKDASNFGELGRLYYNIATAYKLKNDPDHAVEAYLRSYEMRLEANPTSATESLIGLSMVLLDTSVVFEDSAKLHKVLQSFGFQDLNAIIQKAKSMEGIDDRIGFIAQIWDIERRYYEKNHEYEKAYHILQKIKTYNEEMKLSESSLKSYAGLKIRNEQEQLKNQLLQEEIARQKNENQKNLLLLFVSILSAVTIIGFLIYQNKLRQQSLKLAKAVQEQQNVSIKSMLEGQEQERERIARDLHDGLGNLLSTARASLGGLESSLMETDKHKMYEQASGLLDEACSEVRKIAHEMMPQALRILGLSKAVDDLVAKMDANHPLEAKFDIFGKEVLLDDKTNVMIFRIIQELLNNIVKYAKAKQVYVQMTFGSDWLNVSVEDDGIGFELDSQMKAKGLGLKSIAYRVELIEGSHEFDTRPGHGTHVSITVPTTRFLNNKRKI